MQWIFAGCTADTNKKPQLATEMPGMDMNGTGDTNHSPGMVRHTSDLDAIVLPVNFSVLSSQTAIKPLRSDQEYFMAVSGIIEADERRENNVSSRVAGRIEKLFVRYNYQFVTKGEKIMEVYSPDLNTTQEELLFLLGSNTDIELLAKAEEKLRLLGITQQQLSQLKTTKQILSVISIYSSYNGYVVLGDGITSTYGTSAKQSIPSSSGMGSGMNTAQPMANTTTSPRIREGDYIGKGQTLFRVNDLQELWGTFSIDNSYLNQVRIGTPIMLTSELHPTDTIRRTISFVEPIYREGEKFLRARVYLHNERMGFPVGTFITGRIPISGVNRLLVPYSSVLFLGKRKIVWVKTGVTSGNSIFQARDVSIGSEYDKLVEITSGLSASEEIAPDAGYMIDREGLIKIK